MAKCQKGDCKKYTVTCGKCGGKLSNMLGKLSCSGCKETGQVCPDHGASWRG